MNEKAKNWIFIIVAITIIVWVVGIFIKIQSRPVVKVEKDINNPIYTYVAIDHAYRNAIINDTVQKGAVDVGLTCGGYLTTNEYKDLTERIRSNKKLFDVFQYAKSKKIIILPTGHLQISNGLIEISEKLSDTQIIKFLSTGIIP